MIKFNILDLSFKNFKINTLKTKELTWKIIKYTFGIFYCAKDVISFLQENEEDKAINSLTDLNENGLLIKELKFTDDNMDWKEKLKSINFELLSSNKENNEKEKTNNIINILYEQLNKLYTNKSKSVLNKTDNDLTRSEDGPSRSESDLPKLKGDIKYCIDVEKYDNNNKYYFKIFIFLSNINKYYLKTNKYDIDLIRNVQKNIRPSQDMLKDLNKYKVISINNNINLESLDIKKKQNVLYFWNKLKILNICNEDFLIKKQETLTSIITVFRNKNYKLEYNVNGYILDLYFIDYLLAIECDKNYDNTKHNYIIHNEEYLKKEANIKQILDCSFIRYNPVSEDFNIFELIGSINIFMNRSEIL
jgi:hypothetical protein